MLFDLRSGGDLSPDSGGLAGVESSFVVAGGSPDELAFGSTGKVALGSVEGIGVGDFGVNTPDSDAKDAPLAAGGTCTSVSSSEERVAK